MENYVDKILAVALSQVGYKGKKTNNQLDDFNANTLGNYTKYARDMDAYRFPDGTKIYFGSKNGYDWCDVFVDWCMCQAYGYEEGLKLLCQPKRSYGAGVKYSYRYYKNKGQIVTDPQPGDQIFFTNVNGGYQHTGLVEKVEGGYVYTIEGNSSHVVKQKKYSLGYKMILGYGRPKYDAKKETTPVPTPTPTPIPTPTPEPVEEYDTYTVQKGNSLWGIAKKFLGKGSRYKEIMQLNNKKTILIHPGDVLKIPKK